MTQTAVLQETAFLECMCACRLVPCFGLELSLVIQTAVLQSSREFVVPECSKQGNKSSERCSNRVVETALNDGSVIGK
jgi:hypothetical protein